MAHKHKPSYAGALICRLVPRLMELHMVKIAPSILSADFSDLKNEISSLKRADYLHIDVMDGIFVPNISIGIPVVKSIRKVTDMVLDVHLMIDRPIRYAEDFIRAGGDIIVLSLESDEPQNIFAALDIIKTAGKKAGLAIKPKTPAGCLLPFMPLLDLALVMTVEPGFSGQSFMPENLSKLRELRELINREGYGCELEVDGGVNPETARLCREAGADVLVAGNAVFASPDRASAIREIRGGA